MTPSFDGMRTAHIDMKDFGLVVPSYLGLTVPAVDVVVHYVAHDV